MREVCFISVKHVFSTVYSFFISLGDKSLISNNSPPGLDIAFLEKHWGDLLTVIVSVPGGRTVQPCVHL